MSTCPAILIIGSIFLSLAATFLPSRRYNLQHASRAYLSTRGVIALLDNSDPKMSERIATPRLVCLFCVESFRIYTYVPYYDRNTYWHTLKSVTRTRASTDRSYNKTRLTNVTRVYDRLETYWRLFDNWQHFGNLNYTVIYKFHLNQRFSSDVLPN